MNCGHSIPFLDMPGRGSLAAVCRELELLQNSKIQWTSCPTRCVTCVFSSVTCVKLCVTCVKLCVTCVKLSHLSCFPTRGDSASQEDAETKPGAAESKTDGMIL